MKGKRVVLSILAVLCMGILFTACGGEEHTHKYTETTTVTCTENGLITYTCDCGDTYTEEIPALGHDEISHEAQEPTCTEI